MLHSGGINEGGYRIICCKRYGASVFLDTGMAVFLSGRNGRDPRRRRRKVDRRRETMRDPKALLKFVLLLAIVSVHGAALLPESQGSEGWPTYYDGPGNSSDCAWALAVDAQGNVYVTGSSTGIGTGYDYATIKYSPTGQRLWARRYNGPTNDSDYATALAVDAQGNVYVTGYSGGIGSNFDYATIKYSPTGQRLWARRYNGPGNSDDEATAVRLDSQGNVYVSGKSTGAGTGYDYATLKYSPSGDRLWARRYNGPGNGDDSAEALAVDAQGNVFVTGYSGGIGSSADYATLKYSPSGDRLWARRYNGPGNGDDAAAALAPDSQGNVYVTGRSTGIGTGYDYATIKYNPSGARIWVKRYNGLANGSDRASALSVDSQGNVYVTGGSGGVGSGSDYVTIKYSPSGGLLWARRYDGPANDSDSAHALAVDGQGNVYVTGESYGTSSWGDYATIKYNPSGARIWVKRYNGPGNGDDSAYALAVDSQGNVYVTGYSYGEGSTPPDYVTLKYSASD
jgi:uncharacterized delta-60 repeat protein